LSLSVLIPVYNRDVTLLVSSLASLLSKEKIPAEIILLDDASAPEYDQLNQHLADGNFIFYSRNLENKGRIKTRELLAEQANYPYLLFLDCDVKISGPGFINAYFKEIKNQTPVCCGGLLYDKIPHDCNYRLHWKYGTERESSRDKNNSLFLVSNLLITKHLFLDLSFEKQLMPYGHEDTLWGIELKRKRIAIKTIDNPVIHEGLSITDDYLEKSLQAVENLVLLEQWVDKSELAANVRLYRWYQKLNSFRLAGLVEKTESLFHSRVLKNLHSCNPRLFFFDLFRLASLIRKKSKG